jgi:hypothetical protein
MKITYSKLEGGAIMKKPYDANSEKEFFRLLEKHDLHEVILATVGLGKAMDDITDDQFHAWLMKLEEIFKKVVIRDSQVNIAYAELHEGYLQEEKQIYVHTEKEIKEEGAFYLIPKE